MSDILLKVQAYLDEINFGRASCDPALIETFGERSKALLSAKINEKPRDKFYLRMSNIGRPLCQLQLEKLNTPKEPPDNFFAFKMIYGDCIELLAIVILKAAGVNVQSEQISVSNEAGIEGTYDVEIDNKIYDIKSASAWAWLHKFHNQTIQDLWTDDPFGYVCQGIGYSHSVGKRFGGWIAINKETGQWTVLDAVYDAAFEKEVLDKIAYNQKVIESNAPFKKCYSDVPEIYYKVPTGNRVLDRVCSFCRYKEHCWPDLKLLPQIPSKARERKLIYYTHIQQAE